MYVTPSPVSRFFGFVSLGVTSQSLVISLTVSRAALLSVVSLSSSCATSTSTTNTTTDDDDLYTPGRHLPTPGQRGYSPQRHTAAGTGAPTITDTGNSVL